MKLLRQRDFAVLFLGRMLSTVGNHFFTIALLWYVLTQTGSRLDVSLAGLMQALPGIAALFTGVYVDRWRKRQTMIVSDVVRAAIAFGLVIVVSGPRLDLPLLLMLVLLLEFVGTFFRPASSALLPLIVAREDLPSAAGLFQSVGAAAQLGGAIGGGALVAFVGVPIVFLVNAITFLASLAGVSLVRVRESLPERAAGGTSFRKEWLDGLHAIGRSKLLVRVVAAALVINFALAPIDVLLPSWVRSDLHGGAMQLSLVVGSLMAGLLVGSLLVGAVARRWQLRHSLLGAFVVLGCALGALGVVPNVVYDMVIGLLIGATAGVANGVLTAAMLQQVPAESRGRVFGTLGALSTVATPAGIAMAGAMTSISIPLLLVACGILVLLAAASFMAPVKDDIAAVGA
jgi:DHA3 family macrolide efflux protein-like MFS transporter